MLAITVLPVSPRTTLGNNMFYAHSPKNPSPRYNAKVLEVVDERSYRLLYTDYGNEEVVEEERIVTSLESLVGELVDVGVHLRWMVY